MTEISILSIFRFYRIIERNIPDFIDFDIMDEISKTDLWPKSSLFWHPKYLQFYNILPILLRLSEIFPILTSFTDFMAEISSTYPGSGSRNISNFINILPILGRNICDSVSHINLHARPRIGDIPTFYRYSRFYSQNIREIGEPFTSGGLVASHALLTEGGEWKWRPTQGQVIGCFFLSTFIFITLYVYI